MRILIPIVALLVTIFMVPGDIPGLNLQVVHNGDTVLQVETVQASPALPEAQGSIEDGLAEGPAVLTRLLQF